MDQFDGEKFLYFTKLDKKLLLNLSFFVCLCQENRIDLNMQKLFP